MLVQQKQKEEEALEVVVAGDRLAGGLATPTPTRGGTCVAERPGLT